jgi:hypothetical protein
MEANETKGNEMSIKQQEDQMKHYDICWGMAIDGLRECCPNLFATEYQGESALDAEERAISLIITEWFDNGTATCYCE